MFLKFFHAFLKSGRPKARFLNFPQNSTPSLIEPFLIIGDYVYFFSVLIFTVRMYLYLPISILHFTPLLFDSILIQSPIWNLRTNPAKKAKRKNFSNDSSNLQKLAQEVSKSMYLISTCRYLTSFSYKIQ